MNTSIIVGLLLIVYGLFKLFVGYVSVFASKHEADAWVERHRWMRSFVAADRTVAGKGLHFALLLFGVYSLLHGIAMGLSHSSMHAWLHRYLHGAYVNGAVGAALLLFYGAVVYTRLPIEKDPEQLQHYKTDGLGSALVFLMMVPIALVHAAIRQGRGPKAGHMGSLIALVLVVSVTGWWPSYLSAAHFLDAPMVLVNGWVR